MRIVLSYAPQIGFEEVKDGVISLDKNVWIYQLAKKINPNETGKSIQYIGRDKLKRIELSVSRNLFDELQKDTLFIMKADTLRRIRTEGAYSLIEFLANKRIADNFDNDLDNPNN